MNCTKDTIGNTITSYKYNDKTLANTIDCLGNTFGNTIEIVLPSQLNQSCVTNTFGNTIGDSTRKSF